MSPQAAAASEMPSAIERVLVVMVTSEADGQAEVDDAGARVGAGVDAAEARIAADAVDLGIEARVARENEQILAGQVQPRYMRAGDEVGWELIAQRDGLQPQERAVFDERAVHAAGASVVGAWDRRVGVLGRPAIQDLRTLVQEAGGQLAEHVVDVRDLVAIREVEEDIQRQRTPGDVVAEPAEQLRLRRAEQRAVFAIDDTVAVDVGDLVLARRTVGIPFTLLRRRQGAHVPLLPQASHLVAVDRPERLPHLDDEALVAVEEPAVA